MLHADINQNEYFVTFSVAFQSRAVFVEKILRSSSLYINVYVLYKYQLFFCFFFVLFCFFARKRVECFVGS